MSADNLPLVDEEQKLKLEDIEVRLLTEGIFGHYGFDFRDYSLPSLRRRVWKRVYAEGLSTISGLQEKILHDPACMERLLLDLSINTTAMFRDPTFYLQFRRKVVPMLRTYPFVRIWHAGCSTGEEVYSMAILLQEEKLLDRCRIYATDINEAVLARAKDGNFPLNTMQENTSNYIAGGGAGTFSQYYTARYDYAIFRPSLRVSDSSIFPRSMRLRKMLRAGGHVPTQTVAPASASALAIAKPNPPSSATPATSARRPVRSMLSIGGIWTGGGGGGKGAGKTPPALGRPRGEPRGSRCAAPRGS